MLFLNCFGYLFSLLYYLISAETVLVLNPEKDYQILLSRFQPAWYFEFLYKWSYRRRIFLLALNISVLTLKEFSRYQFLLVRAEKSNVFPVHVLPYFMIWLNCCKYFLWPFYCWNMMAIELFLNSISSKYQKLAVGWADVEFCKIADHIKKV